MQMATTKKRSGTSPGGRPSRGRDGPEAGRGGLRQLPPNFQALATGERPPRRQRAPALQDDRDHGLIPGVGNRQARAAYELRLAPLLEASTDDERRQQLLAEVQLLALWRAKHLTGFNAFAQDVLDTPPSEARESARLGAEAMGLTLSALPDLTIALWIRSEAALADACPGASVSATGGQSGISLTLRLPTSAPARAIEALSTLGRAMTGLSRLLPGADSQPRRDSKPPSRPPRKRP